MEMDFCTRRRSVDDTVYYGSCILPNWLFAAVKEESLKRHVSTSRVVCKALSAYFSKKNPNGCVPDPVEELDKRIASGEIG